jgi:hypothetical protein
MSAAYSATVGAWSVDLSLRGGVQAYRRAGGPVHSADLTRFPIGWRVSKVWSSGVQTAAPDALGVPRAVVAKANALANRLTKEVPL